MPKKYNTPHRSMTVKTQLSKEEWYLVSIKTHDLRGLVVRI